MELIRSSVVPENLEFIYKVYKARFRYEKNLTLLSVQSEIAKYLYFLGIEISLCALSGEVF